MEAVGRLGIMLGERVMLARVLVYMFMVLLGVSLLLESPVPVAIAP
jgi:hypothetical protein